ncbi:MAG: DegT/DnrJ/EryC1/StrS family aminotransferase [Melioribacteraceae bacterium]|nr:MAG: DegT/DnrJ/EryC1/StrS family aminotransferase [Melioribacteraceae bacterium]
MTTIPLVRSFLPPREELLASLENVLYSGYIAQGKFVDDFESEFGKYIENNLVVSLNSGTAALHIALVLAGVGKGDEVISTALTAEPTNLAIKMTGAKIVWADIDPNNGTMNPFDAESKITEKTKAILPVDYAGIPVNINEFIRISKQYNISIIEDSAHALGAKYNGEKLGNHFPFVCFSFQAIKHLTTVDGGMIAFNNQENYEKAKLIRWFGIDKKLSRIENDIKLQGYKYHMNNVTAAIGLCQMNYIDSVISKYISNGIYYDSSLKNVPGVELLKYYPESEPSYWIYTLKVEKREDLIKKLAENGIMASELHKRNDSHSFFSKSKCELPNLDKFYSKMLHIPCGWWVTDEDREKIVDIIKSGW